jgi:hypothetical protein
MKVWRELDHTDHSWLREMYPSNAGEFQWLLGVLRRPLMNGKYIKSYRQYTGVAGRRKDIQYFEKQP